MPAEENSHRGQQYTSHPRAGSSTLPYAATEKSRLKG